MPSYASYCANIPPSYPITLLVTYPVFTIQTTVSATSSGSPSLPIGILLLNASGFPGNIVVLVIKAGAIPFVVMPLGP